MGHGAELLTPALHCSVNLVHVLWCLVQEFRRLAALHGLEVQAVPPCEHDPLFCAEDIEIWEVRRSPSGSYDVTLTSNSGEW